ncbi:MAG: TetR/AcrR family transcriptional regulator [Pseudomonadota bacterium]
MVAPLTARGQSTRRKILGEARALLVQNGYDALVLRSVATRCGLTLGNLQYYFKTREDLIYALIEAEASRDLATIEAALASVGEPEERLNQITRRLLTQWDDEASAVYSTLALLRIDRPAFRQLHEELYRTHYRALEDVIARFPNGLSARARATRAQLITALIDGAALQVPAQGREAFFEEVVTLARAIAMENAADDQPELSKSRRGP